MNYSFHNLSPIDFEALVRDLIGKKENLRFEAFCPGPDGGIDGRHTTADGNIILQTKHYEGSEFSKLKAVMKRERASINKLRPARYILATSSNLSPNNKAELAKIIGPSLKSEADIFGLDDLNTLLREQPETLKSHPKLWLSSHGVISQIVHPEDCFYASDLWADLQQKAALYVSNESFEKSRAILKTHRILIISGAPGVGKTTLAQMLCRAYLREEWEIVPISEIKSALAVFNKDKKQIFFFDDFLECMALDRRCLAGRDTQILKFARHVKSSPNGQRTSS